MFYGWEEVSTGGDYRSRENPEGGKGFWVGGGKYNFLFVSRRKSVGLYLCWQRRGGVFLVSNPGYFQKGAG